VTHRLDAYPRPLSPFLPNCNTKEKQKSKHYF
jgi:hypothetical protein